MLNKIFRNSSMWSILFLRLGAGGVFFIHGIGKLLSIGPYAAGLAGTAGFLAGLGVPVPLLFSWLVALVETFGGLFILVGLFTRYAAIATGINMIVALALVHWKNGFAVGKGGYEFVLLLMFLSLSLMFSGAGKKWVLERKLFNKEV
jgi:putative oxidoreductase